VSDDRLYKAHSASKIWLSPEARAWARHWGLSEREFGKFLLAQHLERGDAFASDVADHAPGRDGRTGFAPQELADAFAGDVGVPAGLGDIEGFRPEALADELPDAFENQGPPPDRKRIRSEFPFE
jgi:hypothetical protein